LHLPLGALVVRKIGAPFNPELAIGAVSETGVKWIDYELARATSATESYIEHEVELQTEEAVSRQRQYFAGVQPSEVRNRTGIVVDDGIATGASALVAVESVRGLGAKRVILATPTASPQAVCMLDPKVDQMVVLDVPDPFLAVGMHYVHFNQVSDEEVIRLLREARDLSPSRSA